MVSPINDRKDLNATFFFCVGAQKAATTTLDAVIRSSTNVCLPRQKETKFFCDDQLFLKGYDYYRGLFNSMPSDTYGEIDPDYLFFERAAYRIQEFRPDAKIIILLRDPVERAISHYKMSLRRGIENRTLREAIRTSRSHFGSWLDEQHFSYVERGFYSAQVRRYQHLFGVSNVHVYLFENFVIDQLSVIEDLKAKIGFTRYADLNANIRENEATGVRSRLVTRFIHDKWPGKSILRKVTPKYLRDPVRFAMQRLNARSGEAVFIDDKDRAYLREVYSEDVYILKDTLGLPNLWWL